MRLTEEEQAQLSVKRATVTPLWKGLFTLIKYRTSRNYRNPEFLGPRIGDKLIFSLLVATLYLGIGDDLVETNYLNIGAVLFMWSTLPACAPGYVHGHATRREAVALRVRRPGQLAALAYKTAPGRLITMHLPVVRHVPSPPRDHPWPADSEQCMHSRPRPRAGVDVRVVRAGSG